MSSIFNHEGVNFQGRRGVQAADPLQDLDVVNLRSLRYYIDTATGATIDAFRLTVGNVGEGFPVYFGKTGTTYFWRTLSAGTNMSMYCGATITFNTASAVTFSSLSAQSISATTYFSANTPLDQIFINNLQNIGVGPAYFYSGKTNGIAFIRSLSAETPNLYITTGDTNGIHLNSNLNLNNLTANTISGQSISATTYFSASTPLDQIFIHNLQNIGVGPAFIYSGKSNGIAYIRSFSGGNAIELITGDTITINHTLWTSGQTGNKSIRVLNSGSIVTGNFALALGSGNTNQSHYSTVLNGRFNIISGNSVYSLVGGKTNSLYSASTYSTILNGANNIISASTHSFISHGDTNKIYGLTSAILGGQSNVVSKSLRNVTIIGLTGVTPSFSDRVYVPGLQVSDLSANTVDANFVFAEPNGHLILSSITSVLSILTGSSFTGITLAESIGVGVPVLSAITGTTIFIRSISAETPNIFLTSGDTIGIHLNSNITLNNLTANTISGQSISASTYFSASTPLDQIFIHNLQNIGVGPAYFYSGKTNGIALIRSLSADTPNLFLTTGDTIGIHLNPNLNINNLSANTISAQTISATTLFSASTPLDQIFIHNLQNVGVGPAFIYSGKSNGIAYIRSLSAETPNLYITTGDTNGIHLNSNITILNLSATSISGQSISASTYFSASTPLDQIFINNLQNVGVGPGFVYSGKSNGIAYIRSFSGGNAIELITGDTIQISHTLWTSGQTGNKSIQVLNAGSITSGNFALTAGKANTNQSNYATVGGGLNNIISGSSTYSFLGAGTSNIITASTRSSIINGTNNKIFSANNSAIIGGGSNKVLSPYSFIGVGTNNYISGSSTNSVIVGGTANKLHNGLNLFIGAGNSNIISGSSTNSSILVGISNRIYNNPNSAIIAGGSNIIYKNNILSFGYNVIVGGREGRMTARSYSTILNGFDNQILTGWTCNILNGYSNRIRIDNNGNFHGFATIIGGSLNKIYGFDNNLIGNGRSNIISGFTSSYNTILVGLSSKIYESTGSFISNGSSNLISGATSSSIIGGSSNTLFGSRSSIIGGQSQSLSMNDCVMVPRLRINSTPAGGTYSLSINSSGYVYRSALAGVGEANTAANIGANHGIYAYKSGVVLNFKSLSGGTNIGLVSSTDRITIHVTGLTNGSTTIIRNGINTFTGGSAGDYTVNVTAATLNNITVSGSAVFNTLTAVTISASTYYSGSTLLTDMFPLFWRVGNGGTNSLKTIAGSNYVNGNYGISAGKLNHVNSAYSLIVGGLSNKVLSSHSSIVGGSSNIISGSNTFYSFVGGGSGNIIHENSARSVLVGGVANKIGSLTNNTIYSRYGFVGGGYGNKLGQYARSWHGFIGGGQLNKAEGYGVVLVGGKNNNITGGTGSVLTGGRKNVIKGQYSFLGGGGGYTLYLQNYGNYINGDWNALVGGKYNIVSGTTSFVGGGRNNKIYGNLSFIGGGSYHKVGAYATQSTVVGGVQNAVYSISSFVAGGFSNTINQNANYSSILGGSNNILSSSFSLITNGTYNSIRAGGTNNAIINSKGSSIAVNLTGVTLVSLENYEGTRNKTVYVPDLQVNNLSGSTYQMVVANSNGLLSVQPIITAYDISGFRKSGSTTTGHTIERWYNSQSTAGGTVTTNPLSNRIYAVPFVVVKNITIDRLAFEVTTAGGATSNCILGIYDSTDNSTPRNLIFGGTNLFTAATTTTGVKAFSATTAMTTGLYWLTLGMQTQGTLFMRGLSSTAGVPNVIGYNPFTSLSTPGLCYVHPYTFNYILPSVFPMSGVTTSTAAPSIFVRLEST